MKFVESYNIGLRPTIQAPYDTQSYNRYTYVKNNPLKYTDPSGYSWWKKITHAIGKVFKAIKKYIKVIVAIVVTVVIAIYAPYLLGFTQTIGLSASLTLGQTMIVGAIAGFASGAIMTGTLSGAIKGAIFGAISAGVAKGIGDYNGHEDSFFNGGKNAFAKALAHGISRAAISKAQGGRWSSGFWSGFITSGFSVGNKGYGGFGRRITIMALVGGTVSRISGGKFASGAVSGAFVHMFNSEISFVGKFIRDISGKLNSDFEKKMFARYWNKEGDYTLTENEFKDILSNARAISINGNAITISLYGNDTYDYAIGNATLYFSTDNASLRFYDNYNFDSKSWGSRSYLAEIATRLTGSVGNGKAFNINYSTEGL